MRNILYLAVLIGLIYGSQGKIYTQCELLTIFEETGLAGYYGYSAANWICLAKYESGFNTQAVDNDGWSRDYGIFQINSRWWCNDGITANAENACGVCCYTLLEDNILPDIECAKRIVQDPNHMSAWVVTLIIVAPTATTPPEGPPGVAKDQAAGASRIFVSDWTDKGFRSESQTSHQVGQPELQVSFHESLHYWQAGIVSWSAAPFRGEIPRQECPAPHIRRHP
ncbi:lysozyme C-2-like [Pelodytes ibericus]